uniref:hypothetical protein n=1 Tax=Candidatus Scatocola faecipullorum TaxID=2840917 RepID=UPI004024C5F8
MMHDKYIQLSQKQTEKARMIISSLNLIEIWEKAGATINPVGSFRIGVLAKHRDIDFHIYTDSLDIGQSFAIIAELCRHKGIKKCTFANLAETDECCFEWHLYYEDDEAQTWQIDLIQIKKGSFYDGYFEKTAEKIIAAMTEEQRKTILRLKFETPDELKISGIEYYKAVIQDGVQTSEDLLRWRQTHRFDGIIEW